MTSAQRHDSHADAGLRVKSCRSGGSPCARWDRLLVSIAANSLRLTAPLRLPDVLLVLRQLLVLVLRDRLPRQLGTSSLPSRLVLLPLAWLNRHCTVQYYTLDYHTSLAVIYCGVALGCCVSATMATIGPKTGLRTMAAARFAGGWPYAALPHRAVVPPC